MSQTESYSWSNYYSGNKGKQLMVATSENPGAGFGDPLSVFVTCRSGVAHLSPIYCRLAWPCLCPKCVRVPGVRCKLVVSDTSASLRFLIVPLCGNVPNCPHVRGSNEKSTQQCSRVRPSILLWGEFWSIIAPPAFCDQPIPPPHFLLLIQPQVALLHVDTLYYQVE